jgi:hypothetical protein
MMKSCFHIFLILSDSINIIVKGGASFSDGIRLENGGFHTVNDVTIDTSK